MDKEYAIVGDTEWYNHDTGETTVESLTVETGIIGSKDWADRCLAECKDEVGGQWRNLRLVEIHRHRPEASPEVAEKMAAETGLPVNYSVHCGLTMNCGALVSTDMPATAEAIKAEWTRMVNSLHNRQDMAKSSTGGSWWRE